MRGKTTVKQENVGKSVIRRVESTGLTPFVQAGFEQL